MWFQKKNKAPVMDTHQIAGNSNWLEGYAQGKSEGMRIADESFDRGFQEGYNKGRADGIEDTKQAAIKALTQKGNQDGKLT